MGYLVICSTGSEKAPVFFKSLKYIPSCLEQSIINAMLRLYEAANWEVLDLNQLISSLL